MKDVFWQSGKYGPFLHTFDFFFLVQGCHKLFVFVSFGSSGGKIGGGWFFLATFTKDLLISPILWVELIVICLAE